MRLWLRREVSIGIDIVSPPVIRRPGESHHGPVPSQIVHYTLGSWLVEFPTTCRLYPLSFCLKGATVHDASIAPNKRQYGCVPSYQSGSDSSLRGASEKIGRLGFPTYLLG